MKSDRPSVTAAYVAALRAAGTLLPPEAQLCEDPFGATFAGRPAVELLRRLARAPEIVRRAALRVPFLLRDVLWLQLRTRVFDDELAAFVRAGGRQVLLLGAGFDCRGARFASVLHGSTVFEVDHPATQGKKRAVLREFAARSAPVAYVPWDFERDAMSALPARLAQQGHDRTQPTLTIWEGVTMYLTPEAIEAAVFAVRALSSVGSRFAFNYFDRAIVERPPLSRWLAGRVVAQAGEPFRFGWDPDALGAWLGERGFALESDRDDVRLAGEYLPRGYAREVAARGNHVAVAVRGREPEVVPEREQVREPSREPERVRVREPEPWDGDRDDDRERRWVRDPDDDRGRARDREREVAREMERERERGKEKERERERERAHEVARGPRVDSEPPFERGSED